MNPSLLAAPVTIPLLFAALILAVSRLGQHRQIVLQQILTTVALLLNLAVAVLFFFYTQEGNYLVYHMGRWDAPIGITVICDAFSAIMLLLTAILSVAILPFAIGTMDYHRERMGYYPLSLFLLMGVNGAFLAGDLFNLYVFFEVLLMSSFVLMTLGGTPGQINGGIRYVLLNLLASTILLIAAGVTYGSLGTLNMAQIAQRLEFAPPVIQTLLAGLLFVSFGSKAGLFPLFFWLPSSYHTPHPAVTALLGGILTKVGVYTVARSFTLFFPDLLLAWETPILTIAGLTMLIGVLGAFAQPTIRRLLSFHIISQVGYMLMGIAIALSGNKLMIGFGLAAAILFIVHNMLVKTALMMAGGVVELEMGSGSLSVIGGLVGRRPFLAVLFFIAAFSLAGIPPSSGFVGKLALIQITLDTKHYFIAGVSIFVGLMTTMSMVRLWQYAFWGEYRRGGPTFTSPLSHPAKRWFALSPIVLLIGLSLSLGIFFGPTFKMATIAAEQALDRAGYIDAVNPRNDIPDFSEMQKGQE